MSEIRRQGVALVELRVGDFNVRGRHWRSAGCGKRQPLFRLMLVEDNLISNDTKLLTMSVLVCIVKVFAAPLRFGKGGVNNTEQGDE
jgi:hypothetical protein